MTVGVLMEDGCCGLCRDGLGIIWSSGQDAEELRATRAGLVNHSLRRSADMTLVIFSISITGPLLRLYLLHI